MRIVHITTFPERDVTHFNGSGVSAYAKNLITNTQYSQNDEIFILAQKIPTEREKYNLKKNMSVERIWERNLYGLVSILKRIKYIKPDVVHIQHEVALFGGIPAAYFLQWLLFIIRISKVKIVITFHGIVSNKIIDKDFIRENAYQYPVWLTKLGFLIIFSPLSWLSNKIITHEEYFKKILSSEYFSNADKICVIPHGVENSQKVDKEVSRKYLEIEKEKNVILFMGYFSAYKGLELLIDAFSDYLKEDKKALLIIGAGLHPRLRKDKEYKLEYNRLKGKVELLKGHSRWVGFIEEKDISYYYCASDLAVYPYTKPLASSGPMAISMGYEQPFIASEVFSHFLDEKLIFKKNKESLLQKLSEFFYIKNNCKGDNNQYTDYIKKLKEHRLFDRVARSTLELYREL